MVSTPYIINEIYDILQKSSPFELTLEALLALGLIWIVFYKRTTTKKLPVSEEDILARWTPEPLVAEVPPDHPALKTKVVHGPVGRMVNVNGKECINMATHNYLGLAEDEDIKQAAIKSLRKYGVGSCGPRGFYGTVDVHLELEERLAKFMQVEEAVVYSYAFSTIASAIPAYSKRGDLIFVDECVNFAIQKGLDASRSKIFYYKHNDMDDLERLLQKQQADDKRNPAKAKKTRRFLVAESIYMNTGEVCPLPRLVELRARYKLRLFLDESLSFGVLGDCGRGLIEHCNVDKTEVDLVSAGLEWSAATIGGFCAGSSFIVEHQRLSGLGYCFSASLPPLLTQAAISALDRFESSPRIFVELRERCRTVSDKLSHLKHFQARGDPLSPVKHLYLKHKHECWAHEKMLLDEISTECIDNGLAVVAAEYLEHMEKHCPRPSIRLTVNRLLSEKDIDDAFRILEHVSEKVLASAG
ncbi:serine palmitoyltransferase 1 [Anopheles stephensi]|uniref:serine palmitoyltransferase 1 n=1 Tax=Anopheles stephensi TaxID=30069 RepID=UPI0016589F4B|nr:serine palmitoyltransferase 1 [Anopheles stephensi]XP_035901675.1 serine palmitoyltransferase 1 [Anopheles stephensi]XP_035901676.1 serine palmitoyltransferase 1 [Anopheles stephensi]XP_035901677.1 serine palmitoyltransferase 1 [Anopheles stephensi]XP_035901678.1 serine palmitoyltransferase 1 [Anopheles stephensi]